MKIEKDFVLFRPPGKQDFYGWNLTTTPMDTYFIFRSFDNEITRRLYPEKQTKLSYKDLLQLDFELALNPISPTIKAQTHQAYLEKCNSFIQALREEALDKVIFSRIKLAGAIEDMSTKLIHLAQKYPDAMVYLAHFDGETWLGASPEKLVQIEDGELSTVALASTKAVADRRDWTDKEIKEHQCVVDYVAHYLQPYKSKQEETKTITLGEIQHLKTQFSAQISSDTSPEEVCNLLHPTPAVCGMPKDEAHQFILNNEGYNRKFYTGYFGVISKENTEVYVNLRCAQVFSDALAIYVGGGLLAESDAEKEWQETEWKSQALLV